MVERHADFRKLYCFSELIDQEIDDCIWSAYVFDCVIWVNMIGLLCSRNFSTWSCTDDMLSKDESNK